jgi:hypothetical protein
MAINQKIMWEQIKATTLSAVLFLAISSSLYYSVSPKKDESFSPETLIQIKEELHVEIPVDAKVIIGLKSAKMILVELDGGEPLKDPNTGYGFKFKDKKTAEKIVGLINQDLVSRGLPPISNEKYIEFKTANVVLINKDGEKITLDNKN